MEIWLDTDNLNFIQSAAEMGIVKGVTTNPTIVSASDISPQELIKRLLTVQEGTVAVQVLSDSFPKMVEQAKALYSLSDRILVKIPVTQDGIRAIHVLTKENIPTLATAIFEPRQALFAFKAGACYLAPYLGRIADQGINPIEMLIKMQAMKERYGFIGQIMAAGIREITIVKECLDIGICAITLSEKIFNDFVDNCEPTLVALKKFSEDWTKSMFYYPNFYFEISEK